MNRDFAEMLSALCEAGAEFLVVGAYALAAHGYVRATGDIDIWVRSSDHNADRVWAALLAYGAPLHGLSRQDLVTPDLVFQIGVPPSRVDMLTSVSGVTFDDAWSRRQIVTVEGLDVPVIGREDLIANKRATGRSKDLGDVEELTRRKN